MSVEQRTLVRGLASQSGRAPGVYPSHGLYLLTGLLTSHRDGEDEAGRRGWSSSDPAGQWDVGDAQDARRLAHNPETPDHACQGWVVLEALLPHGHGLSARLPPLH